MDEYVSVRVDPCQAQKYAGYAAEANRHKIPDYVDKDKLKENMYAGKTLSAVELRDYIADLRKSNNKQNLRKDARLAFSGIITFSHEAQEIFNALDKKEQANIYMDITNAIAKRHNTRALSIALHADETAPHAHFMICAYDKNGDALRLNPKDTSELQDIAGEVLKQHSVAITRGKTISQRLEESRITGEEPNIKHKTVHELHKTMAEDLKKANKVNKIQQETNRKLLDFNALKKLNLGEILTRFGYIFNRKESSETTKKYESDNDTLIVKKASSGDYVYFNTQDDGDCGTIVDFAKNRKIDLHTIQNANAQVIPQHVTKTKAAKDEERDLKSDFLKLTPYNGSYLTNTRMIKPELIKHFNARQDGRGNACFPHFNSAWQLTGWEVKNAGFTGYCAGGKRNLGITHVGDKVENIVICESSIDAMSYAQMFEPDDTIYISTGGTLTDKQLKQIGELADKYSDATVIAATDNDAPGNTYADKIAQAIPRSTRQTPVEKDWNDDLKALAAGHTSRVRPV